MRSSSRLQYNRSLASHKIILAALALVLAGAASTPPAARAVEPAPAPVSAVEWERVLRDLFDRIWIIIDDCPPPRLEDSVAIWCHSLNTCYAVAGIRQDLTPQQRMEYAALVFDALEHLEQGSSGLDPDLHRRTTDTLLDMFAELSALEEIH